jgi:hypothetical protein
MFAIVSPIEPCGESDTVLRNAHIAGFEWVDNIMVIECDNTATSGRMTHYVYMDSHDVKFTNRRPECGIDYEGHLRRIIDAFRTGGFNDLMQEVEITEELLRVQP